MAVSVIVRPFVEDLTKVPPIGSATPPPNPRAIQERAVEADAYRLLGSAWADIRRPEQALLRYRSALAVDREIGDRRAEARTRARIADLLRAERRLEEARLELQRVVELAPVLDPADRRRQSALLARVEAETRGERGRLVDLLRLVVRAG
jgi:tetratricopeptide (TPR) repeat protein